MGVIYGVPKGRFHAGFVTTAGSEQPTVMFLHAAQGHSLSYVREERIAVARPTLRSLLDTTTSCPFGTRLGWMLSFLSIMDSGLIPGGTCWQHTPERRPPHTYFSMGPGICISVPQPMHGVRVH